MCEYNQSILHALISNIHFDLNLCYKIFLNLKLRLRKIKVQNLKTKG